MKNQPPIPKHLQFTQVTSDCDSDGDDKKAIAEQQARKRKFANHLLNLNNTNTTNIQEHNALSQQHKC